MKLHIHTLPQKAKQHFQELLKECEWLKGCVAYWTIYPNFFDGKFNNKLYK